MAVPAKRGLLGCLCWCGAPGLAVGREVTRTLGEQPSARKVLSDRPWMNIISSAISQPASFATSLLQVAVGSPQAVASPKAASLSDTLVHALLKGKITKAEPQSRSLEIYIPGEQPFEALPDLIRTGRDGSPASSPVALSTHPGPEAPDLQAHSNIDDEGAGQWDHLLTTSEGEAQSISLQTTEGDAEVQAWRADGGSPPPRNGARPPSPSPFPSNEPLMQPLENPVSLLEDLAALLEVNDQHHLLTALVLLRRGVRHHSQLLTACL